MKKLLVLVIICISFYNHCKAAEDMPKVIQPDVLSPNYQQKLRRKSDLEKGFENQFPRYEYFVQEITNFIDVESSIYFYNYINPTVPEQAFTQSSFNIYKKILLLKYIEKSPKERASMHEIEKFLDTNYKTQRIPSYAYVNNPQLPEPLYMSQLIEAAFKSIKEGNITLLHTLVNNYDLLNSKDNEKNSLLSNAIIYKRNNMVKLLLAKGAEVNTASAHGVTPLMLAAKTGNLEAANFLIKQRCDITKLDRKGMSASDYAKESKNIDIYFILQNSLKQRSKLRRR